MRLNKTLTYSSFAIASLLVIVAFITAKTYTQLAIATALYPMVAYFAYYIYTHPTIKVHSKAKIEKKEVKSPQKDKTKKEEKAVATVVDMDRRAFLKFIGATGISFFLFSLLGRRAESIFFDRPSDFSGLPSGGGAGSTPGVLPTDKYRISEIDDSGTVVYYGFTGLDGSWFIMKEDEASSFRYVKGDSNFESNWQARENLNYDYYHEVF